MHSLLSLPQELVGSVEVMESNQLCNILVLMCTEQGEAPKAVLCSLEYGDLTQCLPTRVSIESEGMAHRNLIDPRLRFLAWKRTFL